MQQPEARKPNFFLSLGRYAFRLFQWVVGIRINRRNLNTRNSFDAIMIVLATYFIFPVYSNYLDIFAQAVNGDVVGSFAVEGFRFSFILSSVWLTLIALFSEVKFPILRFVTLVVPGLLLGIVVTYLLTLFTQYITTIQKFDEVSLFVVTIYPLVFSYFVRMKINQRMKHKPEVPKLTELQRSVYLE